MLDSSRTNTDVTYIVCVWNLSDFCKSVKNDIVNIILYVAIVIIAIALCLILTFSITIA